MDINMKAIEVLNLTKLYGHFKAVDNISFSINEGQIVGFVGKNGAGKSTTIRSMLHFISPTQGTCRILGLDSVKDSKDIKKVTGYMPSDAMFYEGVTGRELFKLCVKFSNTPFETVESLAQYLELDIDKKVSELSLGNRKKVSIIQALLKEVKVLVLDEPTSGLDPLMQERFFHLLLEKKKQGVTIFLSSHNLVEIEKYCDRSLIIKDGKIIDDIDMKERVITKAQMVNYVTKDGVEHEFEHEGDANLLIQKLSLLDLLHVEIKNKSVEDEFIKYYEEK